MTALLDSNVLIALAVEDHVHHSAAHAWLSAHDGSFASCPVTQGALLRMLIRGSSPPGQAMDLLAAATADARHEFWPDDLSYLDANLEGILGHRQVTDVYLAALARRHDSWLATFDNGLAALHADVAQLVPVG
ncbi:MAG: PIN domain-containing protein [Pseudonocardiaceae bacterium]|nr:PIN domain-containing protein [Pseudonocardiaceae bacterium]